MSVTLSLFQEFIELVESKITFLAQSLDDKAPVRQALHEIHIKAEEISGYGASGRQTIERVRSEVASPQQVQQVPEEETAESHEVTTRKVNKRRKRVGRKISRVSKSLN